jgi:hypothetical protein
MLFQDVIEASSDAVRGSKLGDEDVAEYSSKLMRISRTFKETRLVEFLDGTHWWSDA